MFQIITQYTVLELKPTTLKFHLQLSRNLTGNPFQGQEGLALMAAIKLQGCTLYTLHGKHSCT